jgi:hypothetical protein
MTSRPHARTETDHDWLPPEQYDRVVVSCTARSHGPGARRLPDRLDERGPIGAVYVEDEDSAEEVFRALDRRGRVIHVDVERKQEVDLMLVAQRVVSSAALVAAKPNDATIRSLDVVVSARLGPSLARVRSVVVGTGNLGFKAAMLLAERGAEVDLVGRDAEATAARVETLNAVLPRFSRGLVKASPFPLRQGSGATLLVSAVSAQGVIGPEWAEVLDAEALVIDVGIDNLSPDFVQFALDHGAEVLRLDTRASALQLAAPAPGFLESVLGSGSVGEVQVVSGGIIGRRGSVVVDNYVEPRKVFGVANGRGGLIHEHELTAAERGAVEVVVDNIRRRQTSD